MTIYKPRFYKQYDKKWKDVSWKGTSIGRNGCGPTAVANVVSALTSLDHTDITPKETYNWICKHGYMTTQGMIHGGIPEALKHYGVESVSGETRDTIKIKKAVLAGNWAIILVSKGKWAITAHFLVLYGIKNNKCLISDSGSSSDARQKDGTWKELNSYIKKGWIIDDVADYSPGDATPGENDDDDDLEPDLDTDIYIDTDELKPNILVIDRNNDPKDFKIKQWKENKVLGVMLEAGYYYDSKHKPVEIYRNPRLYKQISRIIQGKLEFGYYFEARAKNANEVSKEMYEFSFIVRKYPPTLGVWMHPGFITDKSDQNNLLFAQYEQELVRLGLTGRIGIICKRSTLKKFNWKKFQKTWWLWLNDKVKKLDEIDELLDPKFFDTDNKSGELPSGTISNFARKYTSTEDYSKFDITECSDIGDGAAAWAEKIARDDSFVYGPDPFKVYHSSPHCGCWFCDHKHKWYCCNTFVWAAYVHGGGVAKVCKSSGTNVQSWKNRKFKLLGKNLKTNKLQRGDVLVRSSQRHVGIYIGNNKLAHAAHRGYTSNTICIVNLDKFRAGGGFYALRYAGNKTLKNKTKKVLTNMEKKKK